MGMEIVTVKSNVDKCDKFQKMDYVQVTYLYDLYKISYTNRDINQLQ